MLSRRSFLLGSAAVTTAAAIPAAAEPVLPSIFEGAVSEYNGVLIRGDVFTVGHIKQAKRWAESHAMQSYDLNAMARRGLHDWWSRRETFPLPGVTGDDDDYCLLMGQRLTVDDLR